MTDDVYQRIDVIDSHTGGEPTRLVVAGGPELGSGDMASRREILRQSHDHFRSAVVNEPRGWDAIVGALLCEPVDPSSAAGVIFFNNVGYLNMCVHGTIGLVVTLAHLGRIGPGEHRLETPVGLVTATLLADGRVTVRNVPSRRTHSGIFLQVDGLGTIRGDVAWGGNWFFLVEDHGQQIEFAGIERLTEVAWRIRHALQREGIRGDDGGQIDHIELFGPPSSPQADSRNFVLCPGGAYDRSPCGTGTSAKLACLVADGKLQPGKVWRQESIVGSIFEGEAEIDGDWIIPHITGWAYIDGEATLLLHRDDPYRAGFFGSREAGQ